MDEDSYNITIKNELLLNKDDHYLDDNIDDNLGSTFARGQRASFEVNQRIRNLRRFDFLKKLRSVGGL